MERVLPADVAVADCHGELDEPLHPAERDAIAGAAEERVREFGTVRGCARTALLTLGIERPAMVPGPDGAPPWPPGTVGSMTHCPGYRAAAVAPADRYLGIGIDAEPHGPLPVELVTAVLRPDERHELAALDTDLHTDRVLFSAKEAVYKLWSTATAAWLGFGEVHVTLDVPAGTFTARLAGDRPAGLPAALTGRWLVDGDLVLTALVAPRRR